MKNVIRIAFICCLWINLCATRSPRSTEFVVHNDNEDLEIVDSNDALFYFEVSPWPPPRPSPQRPENVVFETVVVEFRNYTFNGDFLICKAIFVNSSFDDEATNCSSMQNPYNRTADDFDPGAGTDGFIFVIKNALMVERGNYGVVITYGNPTVEAKRELIVNIAPRAPVVTSDPEPTGSVLVGTVIKFTCEVSMSLPSADLVWTRGQWETLHPDEGSCEKGQGLEDFSRCSVTRTIRRDDHGQAYICHASNYLNLQQPATASVTLSVDYVPVVSVVPCRNDAKYHVVIGSTLKMTCDVNAHPAWTSLRWYSSEDDNEIEDNFNKTTLRISTVSEDIHERTYTCEANNEMGEATGACEVDVQYGPRISFSDNDPEVKEGMSIMVECIAKANPSVELITWRKVGGPSFEPGISELNLEEVGPDDAGIYRCQASNTLTPTDGADYTHTEVEDVELKVLYKPKWRTYAVTKAAAETGEDAVMYCDVTAYPAVNFEWKLKGNAIEPSSKYAIESSDMLSKLTVKDVQQSDYDEYIQCVASNSQGHEFYYVNFGKPGKPDKVQVCNLINITETSSTISCVPGYDGGIKSTLEVDAGHGAIQVSTSESPAQSGGVPADQFINLDGLWAGSEFNLKIYSRNSNGRSSSSYTFEIRTPGVPEAPPPKPSGGGGLGLADIFGIVFGALLLLASLISLSVFCYWRNHPDDKAYEQMEKLRESRLTEINETELFAKQEESARNSVGARYAGSASGHSNHGYQDDDDDSDNDHVIQNEYVKHPGMVRDEVQLGVKMRHEGAGVKDDHKRMSSLAGMGALSGMSSTQDLSKNQELERQQINFNKAQEKRKTSQIDVSPIKLPPLDEWEVSREAIVIIGRLGEGSFGEVLKAECYDLHGSQGVHTVAVKKLKEHCPREEVEAFYRELQMMKSLPLHPNVIQLCGCCTSQEPAFIIMEFVSNGNLQQYLRDRRSYGNGRQWTAATLSTRDLTAFAVHVASGMDFISSQGLLHRDLAARNVLVSDELVCKVSDFGLSRDVINCREYESKTKRCLPLRWMSPESLFDNIYSTKSDVWSFGVLLWEIVTLGSSPYPGMTGRDVMEMIDQGYRMDRPRHCPKPLYDVMRDCWSAEPNARPSFKALTDRLMSTYNLLDSDPNTNVQLDQIVDNVYTILRNAPGEKC